MKRTKGEKIFTVFNSIFLFCVVSTCLVPLLNLLTVSVSDSAVSSLVILWPLRFTINSYKIIMDEPTFFRSFLISTERVLLGTPISMAVVVLAAYPLSKDRNRFRLRTVFSWLFLFTILFNGGLIPTYVVVKETKLLNTIWALVIPGAASVFNIILLFNFFRILPKELEESAFIDGAGHFRTLWSIYLPLSPAALATITLFTVVAHWNAWFDGIIYMNSPTKYPLQSYLASILSIRVILQKLESLDPELLKKLLQVSERTGRAAQIFIAMIPVLLVYPFLQKYFVKGIVLGSIKG